MSRKVGMLVSIAGQSRVEGMNSEAVALVQVWDSLAANPGGCGEQLYIQVNGSYM